MSDSADDYTVSRFPPSRKVIIDAGRIGSRRHLIHGLMEIDITHPRAILRNYKDESGETFSFTAYLVSCLARTIAQHPNVQAYQNWRGQLVIFSAVDVVTLIEAGVNKVAIPHIIRNAHLKTCRQIHEEIRLIQSQPKQSAQSGGLVKLAPRAPAFMRNFFYWLVRQNPHWFKEIQGTVLVTAVGMYGSGGGWGFGFLPFHTLGVTIGGIVEKPGVVAGQIAIREYLDLSITLDHDIVDGAPAARFANDLARAIESGESLQNLDSDRWFSNGR